MPALMLQGGHPAHRRTAMTIDLSTLSALFAAQPLLALLIPVGLGFAATFFAKML